MLATKYKAIIPSINPFMKYFPEKKSIRKIQRRIKILSLKNETKNTIGGKIIIMLVDFG
jgi:hypothetical protein